MLSPGRCQYVRLQALSSRDILDRNKSIISTECFTAFRFPDVHPSQSCLSTSMHFLQFLLPSSSYVPKISQIAARQIFSLKRYCIEVISYLVGDFVMLYKVFHGLGYSSAHGKILLMEVNYWYSLRSC